MAYMLMQLKVDDYDTWKREGFDRDPVGRKQTAKGHLILRGVDDPRDTFIRIEFVSVEEAKAFRQHLVGSGALDATAFTVVNPPTVVDVADQAEY
jgi:hypothetical protein